jgi:2-oxoacid:acceptor oxidoreductase gamma subunit (pyruvate/2-ketoisovalerate family)
MPQKTSLNNRPLEIRWHGRGGQGAITAAKIVAEAAYLKGYKGVTAAPSFGAERRGAPVSASTRISDHPVLVMSQVENPDIVMVLDHTLLTYPEVIAGLNNNGWLIVNSPLSPRELGIKGNFNIATADATRICLELGIIVAGQVIVNTAILGALAKATRVVDLPTLEKVLRDRFSKSTVEMNLAAVHKTHDATRIFKSG